MFSKRGLLLCTVLVFGSAIVAVAMRHAVAYVRNPPSGPAAPPVLECTRYLDLGEHEQGTIATGFFTLTNAGGGDLIVNHFRTSCSCTGVERESAGRFVQVESVHLASHQSVELAVRIAVGVRPGLAQAVRIDFSTNDPAQPTWSLTAAIPHVKGGVYADPPALSFGEVALGARAIQIVDLYDNGKAGRAIASAHCTNTEAFIVRLLPAESNPPQRPPVGKLIARLQVTARTDKPRRLDSDIEIRLAGEKRQPDRVHAAGAVVGDVQWLPRELALPRKVGGTFVYSARILFWTQSGKPMRIKVSRLPPGLHADVQPMPGHRDRFLAKIGAEQLTGKQGEELIKSCLHVEAALGDTVHLIDVPVLVYRRIK